MTEAEQVMKRCQIGTRNYEEANNLHADCYRVIGKLLAEKSMREVQRLGQEIEQEPVAWVSEDVCKGQYIDGRPRKIWWECNKGVGTAFYTRPPQRTEQEPVAMRMPKVGDEVVCIEDNSLGTVEYLTAGGSPEIKFDDGSHGTYLLREFAELFRYATPPQRKPLLASEIVTMYAERPTSDNDMIDFARAIEAAHGIKENT